MPRNRVRSGIAKTLIRRPPPPASRTASRSTLPLASIGSASSTTSCARRPGPRVRLARPSRGPRSSVERRPTTKATSRGCPTPRPARRAPRPRGPPGARAAGAATAGAGHVDPAADDHVVEPAEHLQPAVLVDPAGVRGAEPAVDQHLARSAPGRRRTRRTASAREIRSRPSRVERERDAVERDAVVDAAAGGLRRAVRRDHASRRRPRRGRAAAGSIGPPPSSTVRSVRSAATSSACVEQPVQLGRHQGDVGRRGPPRPRPRTPRAPRAAPAAARRPPSGRRPARPRRTTPEARAATGPRRRAGCAVAATDASTARRESTTRLGRPVEPEVSTTSGSSSAAATQPVSAATTSAVDPRSSRRRMATRRYDAGCALRRPRPRLLESFLVATPAQWLAGARPRTLPAAVSPVLAGTGVAAYVDGAVWWKALLALVVSLALQVAVNYANDYSDGIRGTDADRVGRCGWSAPGSRRPASVKRAAFLAFGVAGVAGLVLAASTAWWLVAVGARLGAGRLVLHRRLEALRLPRARRGDGLRLLRAGRRGRHDLRPDRDVRPCPAALRRRRRRRARLRDPRRQQPARHPDRHRWPASAPSPSCSAPTAPGRSTCCWSSRPPSRCVAVALATTWWALLGLGFLVPGAARRARPSCRARSARR